MLSTLESSKVPTSDSIAQRLKNARFPWLAPAARDQSNLVVVRVNGGLGNQMFQYAAGRALALRCKSALKLDILSFSEPGCARTFDLHHLRIAAEPARVPEIARLAHTREIAKIERRHKLQRLLRFARRRHRRHCREAHFTFDPDFLNLRPPIYLEGNWQSEKYFSDYADTIRQEFTPRAPFDPENAGIAAKIEAVTSVSLHIRRGDYVSFPDAAAIHGTCALDYYHRAIGYMKSRIPNAHLFVFSDEPDWARENLNLELPQTIVDINPPARSYRDMQLMSMCDHHITANSSFSWWGAWLNPSTDKIVVAPERWFKSDLDTRDLLPAGWVRL